MAVHRWQWLDQRLDVEVTPAADGLTLRHAGRELTLSVLARHGPALTLSVDGQVHRAWVVRRGDTLFVAVSGETFAFAPQVGAAAAATARPEVIAPMPGKVLAVHVTEGAAVKAGDGVVVLEAMKMETVVRAEVGGSVRRVHVAADDIVEAGQVLVEIAPEENTEPSDQLDPVAQDHSGDQ